MTGEGGHIHPAPHAEKLSSGRAFFMLFGGPIAWFVQICAGASLMSWPCFPHADRLVLPIAGYGWTRAGAVIVSLACLATAVAAGLISLAKLREVAEEKEGSHADLIEVGHGRTRFTGMWGVILGFGFALASLLALIPFFVVSRCAG